MKLFCIHCSIYQSHFITKNFIHFGLNLSINLYFIRSKTILNEIGEAKMFVVHFFENKTELLNQLLKRVPTVGENLTIKGRKAKVANVESVDEKNVNVQVVLEVVNKSKVVVDNSKKKKR
jgi:hypothetical protein